MKQRAVLVFIAILATWTSGIQPSTVALAAAIKYSPQQEWFRNAGFGMFIHWGVYSVLGDGEWVMENHKMPITAYEKIPPHFNPTKFDAAAWVALAKSWGVSEKRNSALPTPVDGLRVVASPAVEIPCQP